MTQASRGRPSNGIFYGWWNVAASFVGLSLSYAMFTIFAFGVFLKPLSQEFGWQRDAMSFAYTVTNLTIVGSSVLLGILIDRFGVRRVLIPSVALMGLAVASMSLLTGNIYHYYAMYLLIPLLGAGTLPASYSRTIVAWFFRRRGVALGIALAGFGVGAALIPSVGQMLISSYGWRAAYLVFAAIIFVVALPVSYFLIRETPQEMGLEIDGDAYSGRSDVDFGLSAAEASKTGSFWLILIPFLLVGVGVASVIAHLVPMLTDRGVSPQLAASCQTSLGIGLILGRMISGYLMDRFFAPYVAAIFTLMFVVGVSMLALGVGGLMVFAAAIFVGLSLGSEISETAYLVSRYFGPKAYGVIYGFMFAAFQLGSAVGPPAMGRYYVLAGDYVNALWVLAALGLAAAVLVASLGTYPRLKHSASGSDGSAC
jgi:MFS family permease